MIPNDPTQPQTEYQSQQQTPPPAAFCQNCGKPLTPEAVHRVGTAIFCEPCLLARVGAPVPPPLYPASASGEPNPGLAALLGFIPGVGAMYNEQYAKGIVHLIIFAVLVVFSHISGIFGILIGGWEAYMAIEAHHTAKARRDGTPLPNPFGFNDIGERYGFGKAWPHGPGPATVAQEAARAAADAAAHVTASFHTRHQTPPPPSAPWGAPTDAWRSDTQAYTQPTAPPYTQPYSEPVAPPQHGFTPPPYGGAPNPGYTPVSNPEPLFVPPVAPPQASRFPAGAALLIGLGIFCLLATTHIFSAFPFQATGGLGLIGLAVWSFLRRMLETGDSVAPDGSALYPLRAFRAARFPVWLAVIGLLTVANALNVLSWDHSWPLLLILAGIMALISRSMAAAAPTTPGHNSTPGAL